jgi:hypothetical protein
MGAERRDFIVIALGDRESDGYDERALRVLVALVDSTSPDARVFTDKGVAAYFLPSDRGIAAAKNLVSQAEILRDRDAQFASLGIGAARGPLLADFDRSGAVTRDFTPLGETANRASAGVARGQNYREIMEHLDEPQTV